MELTCWSVGRTNGAFNLFNGLHAATYGWIRFHHIPGTRTFQWWPVACLAYLQGSTYLLCNHFSTSFLSLLAGSLFMAIHVCVKLSSTGHTHARTEGTSFSCMPKNVYSTGEKEKVREKHSQAKPNNRVRQQHIDGLGGQKEGGFSCFLSFKILFLSSFPPSTTLCSLNTPPARFCDDSLLP